MAFADLKSALGKVFTKDNVRPIAICAALLGFCWFAVFGDQGLYQLHKTKKLREATISDISRLKDRMAELKRQKELLTDRDHLELVIRRELGYVKPGETVFQQISP